MTPAQVLVEIRRYATQGRITLSAHARKRGRERGATFADIREALMNARVCEPSEGCWKATGRDRDGDPLTCVVAFEADLLVVTVFEEG